MRKLKVKPGAHVFVLSNFVLEKVFRKKQPVSEIEVSDVESSEVEFPDEKKQGARNKNQKSKSKFF